MKTKISKILSSLLIVSFLLSVLAVFASAEAITVPPVSNERSEYFKIFYNRDFEEGWDYLNGFYNESKATNTIKVDYEEDHLRNYNYFLRYEANSASSNCYSYFRLTYDAVTQSERYNTKGTVVEFSVKADDLANVGKILWMTTAVGRATVNLLSVNSSGNLEAFPGMFDVPVTLGALGDEWINLAFAFDWTTDDLTCTLYQGSGLGEGYDTATKYSFSYPSVGDVGLYELYFGFTGTRSVSGDDSIGMSVCFDNIKLYQGTTSITELEEDEYGESINTLQEKTIDIKESAYSKSKLEIIEDALAMKIGVDQALARNERYSLIGNAGNANYNGTYGAPVKSGDDVLVPLQLLLDYIGFPSYTHPDGQSFDITTGTSKTYITLGRSSATVDGERVDLSIAPGYIKNTEGKDYLVIALSDVPVLFPGWLAVYDDMGLIIVYEDMTPDNLEDNAPLVNRETDLATMVNTMKKFVYKVSDELSANAYVSNGTQIYNEAKTYTDNFSHPYLVANADTFAALKTAYSGNDATYKGYVDEILADADKIYADNADSNPDGSYKGIKEGLAPVNPYADGKALDTTVPAGPRNQEDTVDGYDQFGKMPVLVDFAEILPTLGFAYQITGNAKYALLAYDWSLTLAQWTHWGPGYMQDCAEATSAFAIGYDWLYNGYKALGLDTAPLADAIYNLGVHDGYVASTGAPCQHARSLGDMSVYNTKNDSTNAVSASGMVIGALAILDYITTEGLDAEYYSETVYLLGNNIVSLFVNGLDMYAPDGSYIESATHWERATSGISKMAMSLVSATGSDYGFMSTWGFDKTCYYASHIETSEQLPWNYHDGVAVSLTTDMFYFIAEQLGDANLYAVRRDQIANGKSATVYDAIFYPHDGMPEKAELELDYFMEGIDAFVSRSDWSEGAMYTGLMGGMNNCTNGQLDSGNFVYYNKGIAWVMDLGAENPNIAEYYTEASRYKFYRASAEGQNVIIMTSNPASVGYGQYTGAGGTIKKTFSNEFGSYALLDNKSVYLNEATHANRGVLVTNDRNTVVLQDEFSFVIVESLVWVMHTSANVTIDEESGNRVAYLSARSPVDNELYTVRATIVSQRSDFEFTLQDVSSPILGNTMAKYNGVEPEYDRKGIKRLAIEATTILFEVAVVFEIIDPDNEDPVQYSWTSMNTWEPVETSEVTETVKTRGDADADDFRSNTDRAATLLRKPKTAFKERVEDLYKALTSATYVLNFFGESGLPSNAQGSLGDYRDCMEDYEDFLDYVNDTNKTTNDIVKSLMGIDTSAIE